MVKFCGAVCAVLAAQAAAWAADPGLLRLVMPDAKVIAGIQVDQTRNSPFGQYVLTHMQPTDEGFKKFMADTGFDPRRDVSEIVMASNWEQSSPDARWLVLARGLFSPARFAAAVAANGGSVTKFQGVDILNGDSSTSNGIAFFDSTNAVMGDTASVKAAIERRQTNAPASSSLLGKVQSLSAANDFWFVTLVPISEFSSAMPDPNLQGAMKGNLLQGISQASGGIRFGDTVQITGEAITRSEKDATALVDVVRFLAGMIQLNRQNDPTAGQVATLLDGLTLKTAGNVMSMSLAIPEKQLEQIFDGLRLERRQAHKKTAQVR